MWQLLCLECKMKRRLGKPMGWEGNLGTFAVGPPPVEGMFAAGFQGSFEDAGPTFVHTHLQASCEYSQSFLPTPTPSFKAPVTPSPSCLQRALHVPAFHMPLLSARPPQTCLTGLLLEQVVTSTFTSSHYALPSRSAVLPGKHYLL